LGRRLAPPGCARCGNLLLMMPALQARLFTATVNPSAPRAWTKLMFLSFAAPTSVGSESSRIRLAFYSEAPASTGRWRLRLCWLRRGTERSGTGAL